MKSKLSLILVVLMLASAMLACSIEATRNEDGSWNITGTINAEEVTQMVEDAVANHFRLESTTITLHDGYITGEGQVKRMDGVTTDTFSFRVDLAAVDGYLLITMSDVRINGVPADPGMVQQWNEQMARNAADRADRNPDSRLLDVTITTEQVSATWWAQGRSNRNNR